VARRCAPTALVLLNMTRALLDRAAEVRQTAASIGAALAGLPGTTVIANADDPMTVWAAGQAAGPVVWVAAGAEWRADSLTCPRCGRLLVEASTSWQCGCGLTRPDPTWWLQREPDQDVARGAEPGGGVSVPLSLRLPGAVNRANALMALAAAHHELVPAAQAGGAISGLSQVAGRYSEVVLGRHTLRLLLAKNPAGWAATLSMLPPARPVVVAVNAREADGRDTSWLWDVDFAALGERPIVASGEHAADVGVRLSYAGLDHHTDPDPLAAVDRLPPGEVDMVANYTAFFALQHRLGISR
jgi:UDP-N-acetylmuramyl tripeptide synthase